MMINTGTVICINRELEMTVRSIYYKINKTISSMNILLLVPHVEIQSR